MKFLFIDEFKDTIPQTGIKTYGLVGILIDAIHYASFKESFHRELEKLGWEKHLEFKGRSMFSSDGDSRIKVEDRINFMKKVVNLSKSNSGKTAKIKVFVSYDGFEKKVREPECYLKNLIKIIAKVPSASNKKKNLVGVYYDNNDCIDIKELNKILETELKKRKLCLFESAFSVRSSLEYPGIMFADYVCYFHQTFFRLNRFSKENMDKVIKLIEKNAKGQLSDEEKRQLEGHGRNFMKKDTAVSLIGSLKKIMYV